MSNLVAIAYDDVDQAQQVTQKLGELMKEHSIELEDAVIVEHRANGKIKLHQPSMAGLGRCQRRALGWPDRTDLLHAAARRGDRRRSGGAAGALSDHGIDDDFMKELGDKLPEGGAAVFVLVREATADKVVPEISKFGGHVIQSSLSNEQETALQEALDGRGTAA